MGIKTATLRFDEGQDVKKSGMTIVQGVLFEISFASHRRGG